MKRHTSKPFNELECSQLSFVDTDTLDTLDTELDDPDENPYTASEEMPIESRPHPIGRLKVLYAEYLRYGEIRSFEEFAEYATAHHLVW